MIENKKFRISWEWNTLVPNLENFLYFPKKSFPHILE